MWTRLAVAAALAAAIPPPGAIADQAPRVPDGLPIRRIEIIPRDLYDPLPEGWLRPCYRVANSMHVRTRKSTVRDQLLIRPGEPWSEARARESERALRAMGILEPQRIYARPVGDSVDVVVETRDDWTTRPELALESAGRDVFFTVSLMERNLLGLGKSVSLAHRETPEGISSGASYADPNLVGSRVRLALEAGRGSEGASQGFEIGVPFYAEDAPVSWLARWSRATGVGRLFVAGEEGASFDRRAEEAELLLGRGWRRGAIIWRLSGSFLLRDRRFGPSRLEPGAPLEFDGPEENHRERLLGMEARWWRPSFEEWEGVDRLGGVEDIDLGWSARLIAGLSPRALGGTADEGYGKVRLDAGARPGPTALAQTSLELSTRLRSKPENLVARVRARWASRLRPHHTLAMGAYGAASQRPDRDFQEILGGLNGMRGLGARGLAGQQAWRLNAEHRWRAAEDLLQLISLGTATFYDLGRTWGPGTVDERWRQDAGVGLRVALPRSGLDRVARLDIAWPIHPAPGDDPGPVISIGSGQAF